MIWTLRGNDMLQPSIRIRALLVTAALSAVAAASGCTAPQSKGVQSLDTAYSFGEASQQTFAAQIKNPSPVYDHRMESSGARATQALERYRTDKVKQPTPVRTSSLAATNSGSDTSGAENASPSSASSSASGAEVATTSSASAKSRSGNTTLGTKTIIPAAGGAINPATGKFYPSAGPNGYTNPVTGEFIPKRQ